MMDLNKELKGLKFKGLKYPSTFKTRLNQWCTKFKGGLQNEY